VGLTFERKWEPRSRALVQIGEPLDVAAWLAARGHAAGSAAPLPSSSTAPPAGRIADALTREIDDRLRAVTLNFESAEAAEQAIAVSALVSELLADDVRPLAAPDVPLADVAGVARRAALVQRQLAALPDPERTRVERFLARLDAFRHALAREGVAPGEVALDTGLAPGAWFVVREAAVVLGLGPLAWWGRVNHWLPLRLTAAVARRTSRTPEDPAMHTLVTGLALVLLFYALQSALVWALAGAGWAAVYLVSLPLAARWDFRFRERMRRAAVRVRSYLRFRREPALQATLVAEARALGAEALALDEALGAGAAASAGTRVAETSGRAQPS
jgi:hypothetical protein